MLIIKKGNLLHADENILAHQVNCRGVMGAGVARQIKKMHPNSFNDYRAHIRQTNQPLGTCCLSVSGNKLIAHLFGQDGYGRDKVYTDLDALEEAFSDLIAYAKPLGLTIAIPAYIGCGLAGGDWNEVSAMIDRVSGDMPIVAYKI